MSHPLKELINNKPLFNSLAKEYGTPLYIYDKNQLIKNIKKIHSALASNFDDFHICYTIKANSNPNIIRVLKSEIPSLGADCSSPGELYAAKLAGISNHDCIFTGNYESQEDLEIAFEQKAHINLDDITSFKRLKKIGIPKEISFRLNPGFGKGAFSQVVTGGKNSKFGVPKHAILDAYKMAKDSGIENFGIQCMTGSGVLDHEYFPKLMKEILKTVELINKELKIDFHHISLGGGYGIPYSDDEISLDFNKVFDDVSRVFHSFYNGANKPELWIEPGKSVVGNTGILLSKVTGIKNSYKKFIGLDAGMETLMRPALYNAHHRIYKIGCPEAETTQTVDFTGRICENTDRLAIDRKFTGINEGDLVAIMDVGAYGFTMSHQFCTRPKAAEILLDGDKSTLIRERESIEDLFSKCEVY
tara:strand:+ start:315 stop:1565 length:1251 start_codon:yes stop_codon:yes gene_type:complete